MARVDVVIPTRNRLELTVEAVRSVQAQTMTDWSLRVIDDGGDDGSGDRLAAMFAGDRRIQIVARIHEGPASARDFGVRLGEAPWVAFLDSDDLWTPTKLEKQLDLAQTGADTVLCWYEWFRPDGSVRKVGRPTGTGAVSPLLTDNMSMPLIARRLLEEIGGVGHQPGLGLLTASEGIEFFVRLLLSANVAVVPEVLVRCRDHPGLRESVGLQTIEGAEALDLVIRHHSNGLEAWPREYSHLLARCGARFVAAGRRRQGYRRLWAAFRGCPRSDLPALSRRYGPFLIKDALHGGWPPRRGQ